MKRTLKQIAEGVKMETHYLGFNPQTEQTSFTLLINHQSFEFHAGLLACIPETVTRPATYSYQTAIKVKPLDALKSRFRHSRESDVLEKILQGRVKVVNNMKWMHVFRAISELARPTAYDLLYSLKFDAEASHTSFEDWASNYGYSNDSIKALDIYRKCQENDKKLRLALSKELYKEVMECEDVD